jgi:hypothetical protein
LVSEKPMRERVQLPMLNAYFQKRLRPVSTQTAVTFFSPTGC